MNYNMGELDLSPSSVMPVVFISQNDTGYTITFNLVKNSSSYTPSSGTSVSISGKKPDNTVFSYKGTLSKDTVTFTLTSQMTVLSGKVLCEIRLTKGSIDVGSVNFIMYVEPSPLASLDNPSRNDMASISQMADYANQAAASAETAKSLSTIIDFTGNTSSSAGKNGLVPAPSVGKTSRVLTSDGKWTDISGENMPYVVEAFTPEISYTLKAWECKNFKWTYDVSKMKLYNGLTTTQLKNNYTAIDAIFRGSNKYGVYPIAGGYSNGVIYVWLSNRSNETFKATCGWRMLYYRKL